MELPRLSIAAIVLLILGADGCKPRVCPEWRDWALPGIQKVDACHALSFTGETKASFDDFASVFEKKGFIRGRDADGSIASARRSATLFYKPGEPSYSLRLEPTDKGVFVLARGMRVRVSVSSPRTIGRSSNASRPKLERISRS